MTEDRTTVYFSTDYDEARARFLDAARARDARSNRSRWTAWWAPGASGSAQMWPGSARPGDDRPSCWSVARMGPRDSPGSACQLRALREADRAGLSVVMVHALNPFGFSPDGLFYGGVAPCWGAGRRCSARPMGLQNPDLGGDLRVCLPDWACVGQVGWSWCGRCSMP
jgi:hypothetical protein